MYCVACKISVPQYAYAGHVRSQIHRNAACHPLREGVEMVQSAFKNRIATYRISATSNHVDLGSFMIELRGLVLDQLRSTLERFQPLKVHIELAGLYFLESRELTDVKTFLTKNEVITEGTDLDGYYQELTAILDQKTQEFAERESGNSLILSTHYANYVRWVDFF